MPESPDIVASAPSSRDVLDDPVFRQAVAYAKGFALKTGAEELSPLLLLAGFARLLAAHSSDAPDALRLRGASISDALERAGIELDAAVTAVTERTLPVGAALQALLRSRAETLPQLLDALVAAEGGEPGDATLIDAIARRASRHATAHGRETIAPEPFAAAAYHAYLEGAFKHRAGLSMQMALHRPVLESLIARRQWHAADFTPVDDEPLPLDATLRQVAEGDHADGHHLLAMVRVGVAGTVAETTRRVTAFHEAGHAIASFILRPSAPVTQLSVIGDDGASGWIRVDTEDGATRTWAQFLDELVVLLAGRTAQQIHFGGDTVDTGSESDLERATRTAWLAIARFGMDPELGPVSVAAIAEMGSAQGGFLIDAAQQRLVQVLKEAGARTETLLRENWADVERVALALAEKKFLDADDMIALLSGAGLVDWPGVQSVWSLPAPREVRFASVPGVCETREGPARYEAGDALVTGEAGETWCTPRAYFDEHYEPVAPTAAGQDGAYAKRRQQVLSCQLRAARRIPLSHSRGILSGRAGDWVVDYGDGNLSIVSADLFPRYFTLDPGVL
jgi:hypothetical protein